MKRDAVLKSAASPRSLTSEVIAGAPLISVLWRARRAEEERLKRQRVLAAGECASFSAALAAAAEIAYRLAASAGGDAPARLQRELAAAGVEILAPAGEPYEGIFLEVLDSIAQRHGESLDAPRIAEVIEPAVLFRGVALKRGKVVVALQASESAAVGGGPEIGQEPSRQGEERK